MSVAGGLGGGVNLLLRLLPDLTSVDAAVAEIGHHVEVGGMQAGNAFMKAFGAATLGLGPRALAGGIAGNRLGGFLGGVGGAAGGIIGGIPGAAVGAAAGSAAGGVVNMAGQGLGAIGGAGTGALATIAKGLRELQGPLGAVGAGFAALGSTLKTVANVVNAIPVIGGLLGPLSDALAGIPSILKDITGTLVSFAAKADPGTFKQWQIALDDTQAVIGHAFVPVLDLMKDGVRLFADTLANLLPNQQEVYGALKSLRDVFAEVSSEVRGVLAEVGPSIRQSLIDGLRQLAHWAAVATKALWGLIRPLMSAGGGASHASAADARSSFGAAWRPAHIGGFEDYQRQLQQAFFSLGSGGERQKRPEEQAAESLADLQKIDAEALQLQQGIKDAFDATSAWLQNAWKTVESVAVEVRNVASAIAEFMRWAQDIWGGAKEAANRLNIVGASMDLMEAKRQNEMLDRQPHPPTWLGQGHENPFRRPDKPWWRQ